VHKLGQQYNGIKLVLNRLFKQAITAGKRVRTETSIGTGAVSISSAAVELAQMKGNLAAARVASVLENVAAAGSTFVTKCPDFNSESLANGRKNWRVSSREFNCNSMRFRNDGSDGKVGFGLYQYCGNRAVN